MKRLLCALVCIFMMAAAVTVSADDGPPELPPGAGIGVEPGYTRYEPGHWEFTDTLYFGAVNTERTADGVTVKAALENENKNIVYTFADSAGNEAVYTVTPYWFEEKYYAEDSFSVGVNIVRSPDEDSAPGGVTASLAIADLTQGENGYETEVQSYFTKPDGTEVQKFNVQENMTFSEGSEGKYYIDLRGEFPVGEADGQKLYAVLGTQDDIDRGTRVFIAREYQWVAEPEEIEVPPQYGAIEYQNEPAQAAIFYAPVIAAVLVVIAVIVFLLRRRRK